MNAFIRHSEMDSRTERLLIAMQDPLFCPPVQACVREPNQRLIDLLTQDEDLTPSQRHEVQILSGDVF